MIHMTLTVPVALFTSDGRCWVLPRPFSFIHEKNEVHCSSSFSFRPTRSLTPLGPHSALNQISSCSASECQLPSSSSIPGGSRVFGWRSTSQDGRYGVPLLLCH